MKIVKNKNGFTLVEILIAMTIVIIFAMMMIGIFNTNGVMNKGRDARRKEDLRKIKVAFEEYFNDKESFPSQSVVDSWNIKSKCGKNAMAFLSLANWPCDPKGEPYKIIMGINKFIVVTNLENKKDIDIPVGWYTNSAYTDFDLRGLKISDINYGVSSTNILWYINKIVDPSCDKSLCYTRIKDKGVDGCSTTVGCTNNFCYFGKTGGDGSCYSECNVDCCGDGCN